MKPQRFTGATIQKVQAKIREALGDDALIYSINKYEHGIEILAGLGIRENDELPKIFPSVSDPEAPSHQLIENLNAQLRMVDEKVNLMSAKLGNSFQDEQATDTVIKQNPVLYHLKKLGFRGKFCQQFAKEFLQSRDVFGPFDENDIENTLLSYLKTPRDELFNQKRVCALVGPSGVGKTTTVAKLAKRFINQNESHKVGLITSDYCDVASKNQLSYYSDALNITMEYANNHKELTIALHNLREMDFILIDTYGVSQRDNYNLNQLRNLMESQQDEITTFITLPCNAQGLVLDEIVRAFRTTNLGGCILTKQDESISLAPVLSVCMHYAMPVHYLCKGPSIYKDIEKAESCILMHEIISESAICKKNVEQDLQQNLQRIVKKTSEVSYE